MYNIYIYIYNNRIEKEKENLGKLEKKKATSYSNEKKLQKAVSLFLGIVFSNNFILKKLKNKLYKIGMKSKCFFLFVSLLFVPIPISEKSRPREK